MTATDAAVEREVKLAADPDLVLPDLSGLSATGRSRIDHVHLPERALTAVYWDTADLRLTRWGHSLRHRASSDGAEHDWTVKLAQPPDGDRPTAVLSRRELTFAGGPERPPPAALSLVRALVRSAPVAPVATIVTHRRRSHLVDVDGRPLLEIDDDEVSVVNPPAPNTTSPPAVLLRFRELEVEVLARDETTASRTRDDEADGLLEAVVDRLRRAGAEEPESKPKVVRALGERALEPADIVALDVGDDATVGASVRAAISAGTLRLLRHDPGVRVGDDDEDVHQARVATRRLRSDLRTFRPLLDEDWVRRIRGELKWAGAELGSVRDADVLYERLRTQVATLAPADTKGAAGLLRAAVAEREAVRSALAVALGTDRYAALLDELVAASGAVPFGPGARPDRPARDVLPGLVQRPWRRVSKAVKKAMAAADDPPDEALHDIRKKAKQARYASEAAAPVVGKRAQKLAKGLAGVQSVLGDLQDAVVADGWLRSHAATARSVEDAFAAGELCALQERLRRDSRSQWRPAWKTARKKKRRAWLR